MALASKGAERFNLVSGFCKTKRLFVMNQMFQFTVAPSADQFAGKASTQKPWLSDGGLKDSYL